MEGGSVASSLNVTSSGSVEQSHGDALAALPIGVSFTKKSKIAGAAPQSAWRMRNVG